MQSRQAAKRAEGKSARGGITATSLDLKGEKVEIKLPSHSSFYKRAQGEFSGVGSKIRFSTSLLGTMMRSIQFTWLGYREVPISYSAVPLLVTGLVAGLLLDLSIPQ